MSTPSGRTGYPKFSSADIPDGPSQMDDLGAHFDALVGATAADLASLPPAANSEGFLYWVKDIDRVYRSNGSAWKDISVAETIPITAYSANWSATAGYEPVLIVEGKKRTIMGAMTRGSGGSNNSVLTIPAGHRPTGNVFISGQVNSSGQYYQPFVSSTGVLKWDVAYGNASLTGVYPFSGSWLIA